MRNLTIIMLSSLLLFGCSTFKTNKSSLQVEPRKGSPVVYIHPFAENYQEASVGALPFMVPSNFSEKGSLGVSALFKDVMLGKRLFRTIKQLTTPYGNYEEAIAIGNRAGVDLVLAGRINYAISGTELGGARVEVSVRFLDVHTGNTVWYIEQTMDQPMDYPNVDMITRFIESFNPPPIRRSAGAPAVPNMLAKIAVDMTEVMAGAQTVSRR